MSTFAIHQPLRGPARKAAYTDTDTLHRSAPAKRTLPGGYTDVDVLAGGRAEHAGRPGSYADVHTLVGRMTAWDSQGRQGSYTDVDR